MWDKLCWLAMGCAAVIYLVGWVHMGNCKGLCKGEFEHSVVSPCQKGKCWQ